MFFVCVAKLRNKSQNKNIKKKEYARIEFGQSLPKTYKCEHTCLFYFNITGSFNDPSNIYLVVFVNDVIKNRNTFLILENNEWKQEFANKDKLIFPKHSCIFNKFGCDFMVIYLFFNVTGTQDNCNGILQILNLRNIIVKFTTFYGCFFFLFTLQNVVNFTIISRKFKICKLHLQFPWCFCQNNKHNKSKNKQN